MVDRVPEGSDRFLPNRTLARSELPRVKAVDCIRAIGAPQRRQILRALHAAGEAQSPNELSRAGGNSLGDITYHVKVLTECGLVALTGTQPKRGAVEHFYASTVTDDELVTTLLEITRAEDGD